MRKSAKRKIYLLIFMFIAAFFVLKQIRSKGPGPKKAPSTTEVMVAVRDLSPGSVLDESDIAWQEEASKSLPRGAVKKFRSKRVLGNMRVMSPIYEGDIILMKYLRNSSASWDNVTPGMAVHAFKINANKGIGSMLKPNMFVRVLYVENEKIVVVIEHARVIAVKAHSPVMQPLLKKMTKDLKPEHLNTDVLDKIGDDSLLKDPKDIEDDDVIIEVTPQMAQMLSIEHGGHYVIIPIKYHPRMITPNSPYAIGDIGRTFMPINSKGNKVIRTIRGNDISFQNLHGGVIPREELAERPVEPPYPKFKDEPKKQKVISKPKAPSKTKPPYRLLDKTRLKVNPFRKPNLILKQQLEDK